MRNVVPVAGHILRAVAWAVLLMGFPCASPSGASDAGSAIAGLDSLSSATLLRALDYLEITPAELGFDKLYAEDDTFRLTIVEELLNDPLKLPAWQQETVASIRADVTHPVALAQFLGRLGEAPDAQQDRSDRDRSQDAWPGSAVAQSGASPAATCIVAPGGDPIGAALDAFIRDCHAAEAMLQRALGALSAGEQTRLLILAPAFWGEIADPVDQARKGQIHRELGIPADTTCESEADTVLDMAVKLDRPALTRAAHLFLAGLSHFTAALASTSMPGATQHLDGVTGELVAVRETPWGLFVIGGPGGNGYGAEALQRIAFLIEPGGDDRYRGRAASAVGMLLRPLAAIVDFAGDDVYESPDRAYALGGAVLGVAALVDLRGDDVYRGEDGSLGAGFFGAGFLYDGQGADYFEGGNLCEGAGAFGLGALVSSAAPDAPPGPELDPDRAFEAGLVSVPGTGAVPVRYDENDVYVCARQSQGFASTFGVGLLYDQAGSDTYRAGGHYRHSPLLPNDFQALSQGFSIGFRPRAAGGVGILADEQGNDFYSAEVYAQGVSYWYSIGLLFDGAGNDRYQATQYAQGAGVHLSIGTLWDRGGNDHYVAQLGVTQGTAHDLSDGMLIDESGNDYYVVSDGQGMSITNSASIFIDGQGNDVYATPGVGQGCVTWARGFCGAGIFLDLEGRDMYPGDERGRDGTIWSADYNAIGIDLDRDIELPGEVVPEIVLTAADSARTVEELFATASIWEVGSAREKVRRARQALIAKGIPAVDYAIRQKLGTTDGLEYLALSELARAYPDSFAARIVPQIEDEREIVRRNVIGLLGELKWRPACAPLVALLGKRDQQKLWSRVIGTLGQIGDRAAIGGVRPFLSDPEERRRLAAVGALAALRDTASIEGLVARLADPLLTVRSAAASALPQFGATTVEPLCRVLATPCAQRAVRVRALGRAAVALRDSTDARSLQARGLARRMLMAEFDRPLGESPAAARAAAVEALVGLGDEETLAFVRLRMQDEADPLVRRTYEFVKSKE